MEESVQEPTHGRWLAKNLSNVAIPVNADIPTSIDVTFVEEFDPHASALGASTTIAEPHPAPAVLPTHGWPAVAHRDPGLRER